MNIASGYIQRDTFMLFPKKQSVKYEIESKKVHINCGYRI